MLSTGSAEVGKNIGLVEDVISQYNRIVSVYLNPANTPQTKHIIFTSIMRIEQYIKKHASLLLRILRSRVYVTNKKLVSLVFIPCFKSYIVYDYIELQLRYKRLTIISNQDLDSHRQKLLNANPYWKQLCDEFGYPRYNPIPPAGGTGQGPPPPPPPHPPPPPPPPPPPEGEGGDDDDDDDSENGRRPGIRTPEEEEGEGEGGGREGGREREERLSS